MYLVNTRIGLVLASMLFAVAAMADVSAKFASDFARERKYEAVVISPAGNYLAINHREGDEDRLSILRTDSLEVVSATKFPAREGIRSIFWATEERLLIEPAIRIAARNDVKFGTGEIYGLNIDGSNFGILFGQRAADKGLSGIRESTFAAGQVIDLLPDEPGFVAVQTYERNKVHNEVLRLNIRNGRFKRLARSPLRGGRFVTDRNHQVNVVSGFSEAGDFELYRRSGGKGEFTLVSRHEKFSGVIEPLAPVGEGAEYLFIDSASADKQGLIRWDLASGERHELFRHNEVDVLNYSQTNDRRIWGVNFDNHRSDWAYVDPAHPYADLHQRLRDTFPGDDVVIRNQTDDLSLAVVYVYGPRNPGTYYLFDTVSMQLRHKLATRPWLQPERLSDMIPIEARMRDGKLVRAFLTLPVGMDAQTEFEGLNLPLVVLVHGGPHGVADLWGFDAQAQLLANNGYAVLQVNYRGSRGRGARFERLGYGHWGTTMQDDITDTVKFVVAEGVADAERICIAGASYGAYAALAGVARDPDLYQCAIGMAGIYDLPLLFERGDIREVLSGVNYLKLAVGRDKADMRARSPAYNAHKIKAAVFLAHGSKDQRAPIQHAQRMRRALKEAGNDPLWMVKKREGHGFANENNRTEYYKKMLGFLKRHLAEN